MEYTEDQLQFIQEKKPELIKKPEPSLNDAIVEFLKKYEVFVKPPKNKSRLDGAIAGAITGIAGADVGGDAFMISGQNKQTATQEWTQWKQWALDHKDFPKFQTDFFDEVHKYNEDIDNKLKDPDFIKQTITPLLEKREKDRIEIEKNSKSQFRELLGVLLVIVFVSCGFILIPLYRNSNYRNIKGKQLCLDLKYDQWNIEKANRLEEFTGIDGSENYDYCAELGVTGMTDEPNPYR